MKERDRSRRRAAEKAPAAKARRARSPVKSERSGFQDWIKHNPVLTAIVLAVLHIILAVLAFEPAPHNGGDNAAYLALARSILSGQGYREIYDPLMPVHTQYPPLFPLMLAGLLALGFKPWVSFKVLVMLCSAAAVALSYLWMRRKGRPELALPIALLIAISPGVLNLSHWELSDVPFWAITMAALLAWERLDQRDTKRTIIATALTILAYFTRSAGLPLIAAAGAWLLWRRRWKQLAIFVIGITPFVFWWWYRARTQGGVDYVQQFWFVNPYQPELGRVGAIDLVRRAFANNTAYLQRHLPILMVGIDNTLTFLLAVITIGLGIFGWVRRLRHANISELFLPLYIALLLAWPAVWSGERFLVPALPFILFYAAEGMQRILRKFAVARPRLIGYAAATIIAISAMPGLVQAVQWGTLCTRLYMLGDRYSCHAENWKDFYATAEFAGRALPENAVVLSRKPRLFWAFSDGVKSKIYPLSTNSDSLFALAKQTGARYVVLDRVDALTPRYLMPTLANRQKAFCLLYALGQSQTAIMGILPGGDTIPDTPVNRGAENQIGFQLCGPEYWRSREVMDAAFRR